MAQDLPIEQEAWIIMCGEIGRAYNHECRSFSHKFLSPEEGVQTRNLGLICILCMKVTILKNYLSKCNKTFFRRTINVRVKELLC